MKAAIEACDASDGVKDGLISDPLRCKFNPATLLCKGADGDACLTAPQVAAVRRDPTMARRTARTREQIFAGWSARHCELGWCGYFVGHNEPARTDFWRYWVFGDPSWDPRGFDLDKDVALGDLGGAAVAAVDAISPMT